LWHRARDRDKHRINSVDGRMNDLEKIRKSSNAKRVDPLGGSLVNPKQFGVFLESVERAVRFFQELVDAVGERRAKQIMKFVAGDKKTGTPQRPEDYSMDLAIIFFIRFLGRFRSDEKIAKLILDSSP